MQQEPISQNTLGVKQQQQMQSQSNQFLLLEEDDGDLQNFAGIGDDLPDVFWDYSTDHVGGFEEASMPLTPVPGLDASKPQKKVDVSNDSITNTNTATGQAAAAAPTSNSNTANQLPQQSQASASNVRNVGLAAPGTVTGTSADAENFDINSLSNLFFHAPTSAPLPASLSGFPFLLPQMDQHQQVNVSGNFPQLPTPLLGVNVKNPIAQQTSGNISNQQQQQTGGHQAQIVNTVNILPRINTQGTSQGNTNSTTVANTRPQQQQSQQQQQPALHTTQIFGVPAANFNPHLAAFHQSMHQQQQPNNAVQNLQYLQQLQGNSQQQLVQQQLFSNGGIIPGNNPNMLPPQQQILQTPQHQMGMQQQQQQQPKGSAQHQATSLNNPIQQQQQQLYQSQMLAQGGTQILPQGVRQNTQKNNPVSNAAATLRMTQPQSAQNSKPPNSNHKAQLPEHFQTNAVSTNGNMAKAPVVSSSDTDGEHTTTTVTSAPLTKKMRRSPVSSNHPNVDNHSTGTGSSAMSKDVVYSSQDTSSQHLNVDPSRASFSFGTNAISAPSVPHANSTKKVTAAETKSGDEQMSEEDRALANRKRNREHARNTRARKKAYLESLKTTLDELCRERDSLVSERAGAASMLLEIQKTRTDVLLSFFALRSIYEKRRALWSSILDESFTCVLPVTPYRSFPASEVQISKCQRTILGVDGMIGDTASMHVLLDSLVDRSKFPDGKVEFRYTLIAEEAVVSGSQMMARWNMTTTNATKLGAKREIKKMGMLCARFNSAHKIVALELMFDVMAFMLQLKQAAGACAFTVVPNTVQTCIGPFGNDCPMVMTLADRPYTIVQVNEKWENMTGWKADDVVGKESCKILQGDDTQKIAVDGLMTSIRLQRPAFAVLINYTRGREKMFKNFISLYPLSTDSKITHYVGLTAHIEWIDMKDVQKTFQSTIKEEKGSCSKTNQSHRQILSKALESKNDNVLLSTGQTKNASDSSPKESGKAR